MQKSRPHFARGVLFALIGGVSWAFSGTCAEFLFETQHLSPAWVTSVRCMISGVVFLILAAIIDRERFLEAAKSRRAWIAFAVNGLFGTVFCQFTYLTSISYTDSGTTTVLSMVGLVLVMGYSCRASHRLPRKREVFGLVLTLVGVVLIATNGDISSLAMPLPGLVWGLLSAVGLAAYNIIPVKLIGRYGSLVTMGFSMFVAGASMCFIEQPWTVSVDVNTEVIMGMAAIIVVGTVIAAWIYMQAIADIGAVKASMIAAVEPVAATIFTVTLLGTRFEIVDLVGFACIVAMVLLVSSKPDDEQKLAEDLAGKTGEEDTVPTPESIELAHAEAAIRAAKAASGSRASLEEVPAPEPVVLWDPAISQKAREKANSGELSLEEMICSPEAAHLVDAKSNTKDTVRHGVREGIALTVFGLLVVAGFIALTTYISAGHNLNYASTGIDDIAGDMSGYGVILYEGTVESSSSAASSVTSDDALSSNDSARTGESDESDEGAEEGASAKNESNEQSVKGFVKMALGLNSETEEGVSGSAKASESTGTATSTSSSASDGASDPMTMDEAKQIYEAKKATVLGLDVNDLEQYQYGRIIMKGGHTYGVVSITDDELAALDLPKAATTTKTTITTSRESRTSSVGSSARVSTKSAYANVAELLADVDVDSIDEELVARVGDVIDHFRNAGVDIIVVLTHDVRPMAAIDGADVVITVRSDERFSQSQMINHTLYVDTPEVGSVGALLVAPGNVVSSRVLTGEATSAGASTSAESNAPSYVEKAD